jgi:hypothetical protein
MLALLSARTTAQGDAFQRSLVKFGHPLTDHFSLTDHFFQRSPQNTGRKNDQLAAAT